MGRRGRRVAVAVLAMASIGLTLGTVAADLATDAPDYAAIHAGAGIAAGGGDPYDPAAVAAVETRDEGAPGVLPYFYPPGLTALQQPLAHLDYRTALHIWGVVIVLAALGMLAFVARGVWRGGLEAEGVLAVGALGLAFAPLRRGLELGQVDPLVGFLGAAGLLLALRGRNAAGGVAASLMLLKPQVAALPLLGLAASRRWRLVAGIGAGVALQAAAVAALAASGVRLDLVAWLHAVRSGDPHRAPVVAAEVVALAVTLAIVAARRPWRHAVEARDRLLLLVSLSAVATAIVGPWAKLNPQSDVLLLVPAALVAGAAARGAQGLARSLLVGCAGGGLLGDSLFAVSHYDGLGEAVVAVLTVACALAAVAAARPGLRGACAVAGVVNAALTLPAVPPGYDGVVSALAAAGLAALLCTPGAVEVTPVRRRLGLAVS